MRQQKQPRSISLPLPVHRERVGVRASFEPQVVSRSRKSPHPTLSRRTGRGECVAVVALLCSMIAGCAVDQDKEVEIYRRVIDLEPAMFDETQPVSLREALLFANRNNENLAIEGEAYLRTVIQRRRSVAQFLPTVDLTGTYQFRDEVDSDSIDIDDVDRDDNVANSSISRSSNDDPLDISADLNYNIFRGFRDVNSYWRDTFRIEQQRNNLLSTQEALLLDVAQIYYEVLRAESTVRVFESSLKLQEERLRDTRGRLRVGTARSLDVAQTEAQVAATRTTLISAKRDVDSARTLLALLTGAPVRQAILTDAFDLPESIGPLSAYLTQAAVSREDLAASAAAERAARRDVKVAFGQYYPSISLNLSTFLYRESVPDERAWDGLLVASVPLFSAGRIRTDVREAWSFFREALLVRSYLTRQVDQEVRDAYLNLAASEARVASVQSQLAAAEQAFRQSEASYTAGLATNLDRVTAQDALLEAQLRLASEEYDRKVIYLSLVRATGQMREQLTAMPATSQATTRNATTQRAASPATQPLLPDEGFRLAPVMRTPEEASTRPGAAR